MASLQQTLMLKFSNDPTPFAYQVSIETYLHFEHLTELQSIPQEAKASILSKIQDFEEVLRAKSLQQQILAWVRETKQKITFQDCLEEAQNSLRDLL